MEPVAAAPTVWSSWHLHLPSTSRSVQDRVALEVIRPVVAAAPGRPWFFIRYWARGPHLRLRVGDVNDPGTFLEDLARRLGPASRLGPGEDPLDVDAYTVEARKLAAQEGLSPPDTEAAVLASGVYPARYEPEYDRYGGAKVLPLSEQLFQVCSELALDFLASGAGNSARAGVALFATQIAEEVLDGTGQFGYAQLGLNQWRRWLRGADHSQTQELRTIDEADTRTVMARGRTSDTHGDQKAGSWWPRWRAAVAHLVGAAVPNSTVPVPVIVFSQIHMLHNRLGLSPAAEVRTYATLAGAGSAP